MKSLLILLFAVACNIFFTNYLPAQSGKVILNWTKGTEEFRYSDGSIRSISLFTDSRHEEKTAYLPLYKKSFLWTSTKYPKFIITDVVYVPDSSLGTDPVLLNVLSNEFAGSVALHTQTKKKYAECTVLPYRLNTHGQIEKLISFHYRLEESDEAISSGYRSSTSYAEHSVLAAGKWFKLAVGDRGMYRIDYSFFTSVLGLNAADYPIAKMGVFGNGGGMIPVENATDRKDDLTENPLYIQDVNGDGFLQSGDYLLFYGDGSDNILLNASGLLYHENNPYSDSTYYYFSPDAGSAKQAEVQNTSSASATHTASYADEYVFVEPEEINVLKSGNQWFGQKMSNFDANKTMVFNFPSVLSGSTALVSAKVMAHSTLANSTIELNMDGASVMTFDVPNTTPDYLDEFGFIKSQAVSRSLSSGNHNFQLSFSNPADNNASGYLDYLAIQYKKPLSFSSPSTIFCYTPSVGTGNITSYTLSGISTSHLIWDVSDVSQAKKQTHSSGSFKLESETMHTFIAFDPASVIRQPSYLSTIPNQDLHGMGQPDMVIVTPTVFRTAADELAEWHETRDGLQVEVVETQEVYNEFGKGQPDVSAIRDMMRMLYDRAGTDSSLLPRYLLLYGDATYDPRQRIAGENVNYIPTYESYESLSPTATFPTDDYFVCLDADEGGEVADGHDKLDLAVGRLPIMSLADAFAMNNKIFHYKSPASLGSWRTQITFVADDEDNGSHLDDADDVCENVRAANPLYNFDKIYLDAYRQISTSAGQRSPEVHDAILNKLFTGNLIMNYSGHGGLTNWALERIFGQEDIMDLENFDKLACFVTATCDFGPFDEASGTSAGEDLIMNPNGGSVAMVTTTRLVFSSQNKILDQNFFDHVFEKVEGRWPTIGEVMMKAKNAISSDANNRKFVLLADPAMSLNYPEYTMVTTEINGHPAGTSTDTFKALSHVTIKGAVLDEEGNLFSSFNGTAYPTIFDKEKTYQTLGNDAGSPIVDFLLQKSVIYKGRASIVNGLFEYEFIVPKDIDYSLGSAKISYYGENGEEDAAGYDFSALVGGSSNDFPDDDLGPLVEVYMNNEAFKRFGITDADPLLLVKLSDDHGINVSGTGVGHDLTATLDNDDEHMIVLNDYYTAGLDDYRLGYVRYPFFDLEKGMHHIEVKAWDTYNNSGTGETDFLVSDDPVLALQQLLNYPNPFMDQTTFSFAYNRCCEAMEVTIEIYDQSGNRVTRLFESFSAEENDGYSMNRIQWDGTNQSGGSISKGVYIYRVSIRFPSDGAMATEYEKLVILK